MEILSMENLTFKYPNSEYKALDKVTLSVNQGEFVVLCGESGSGKTTLARLLKREIAPVGEKEGKITYKGRLIDDLDKRTSAEKIGFVFQNPEQQIVTDKVWHELAFGLESLGYSSNYIRLRVGEMSNYFGIASLFHKNICELSGGEKQLVNLASVMAMSPDVLILDEPTSQLDPIASNDFITTLHKLNRELGITLIMIEHRLQEIFPIADKVAVMDEGKLIAYDSPTKICSELVNHKMSLLLPSAVQIWQRSPIKEKTKCPLTVREGKSFINSNFSKRKIEPPKKGKSKIQKTETAIELKDVFFRYKKSDDDVLRGTNLQVKRGEHFCILGGNGSGKTTTLKIISGIIKPFRGKVIINNKKMRSKSTEYFSREGVALLPQNPDSMFIKTQIKQDYMELCNIKGYSTDKTEREIKRISDMLGIAHLLHKHPYDLSGGEIQKCAIGKVLLTNPHIILLDEPTKGFDALSKRNLANILLDIQNRGATLITVTHDVEFAADVANRCGLFFDGEILSPSVPEEFFSNNNFYTTAAARIAHDRFEYAVTVDDVVKMMEQQYEE